MSADPLAGDTSDPQGLNRYSYVRSNPANLTDANGMSPDWFSGFYASDAAAMGSSWGFSFYLGGRRASGFSSAVLTAAYFNFKSTDSMMIFTDVFCWYGGEQLESQKETPELRFLRCVSQFGDANAKDHLTYQNFQTAQSAATAARIDAASLLALWDNENSLKPGFTRGKHNEWGPMQVRRGVVKELGKAGVLPANWRTDLKANLEAGGLYYTRLSNHYGVPNNQLAAAYNGGPYDYKNNSAAQGYQQAFNQRSAMFALLTNCMH